MKVYYPRVTIRKQKSKFSMLKLTSFVIDFDHQASLKISPNSLQKGRVTLVFAVFILSFISSNDSGIGGTNTLLFSFQQANFHFKITSTLTTFGAITICHGTSKSYIHLNIFAFENISFLSAFTKNRLTQKVLKPHTSNFSTKNGSNLSCPGWKFVKIHS